MAFQNPSNNCTFVGRVSNDVKFETKTGANGNFEVAYFSLAVNRPVSKDQKGKGDDCDFIPFRISGPAVNILKNYGQRGRAFIVAAHYFSYSSEQNGVKKYGHFFDVDAINFAVSDSKSLQDQENQGQNSGGGNSNYQAAPSGYNNVPAAAPQAAPATPFEMFTPQGSDPNCGF